MQSGQVNKNSKGNFIITKQKCSNSACSYRTNETPFLVQVIQILVQILQIIKTLDPLVSHHLHTLTDISVLTGCPTPPSSAQIWRLRGPGRNYFANNFFCCFCLMICIVLLQSYGDL